MCYSIDPKPISMSGNTEISPTIIATAYKDPPLLIYPPVFGCLCARDGIKTGTATPNGQDAYNGKLVVMRRCK